MKTLLILAEESILAGWTKTGIAEVADSIANAMTDKFTVSVVCPDGNGAFIALCGGAAAYAPDVRKVRMFGVEYYLVQPARWAELAPEMVSRLAPDVLHSFAAPELLEKIVPRPERCVLTLDSADFVRGKERTLLQYDAITTVSKAYARELLSGGGELARILTEVDFRGLTNGILTPVFAPEKGLMLPAAYTADDLTGKAMCKARMCATYGILPGWTVYVTMCRLTANKGIDAALDALPDIRASGGILIVVGRGDAGIEARLRALTKADGLLWIDRWPSPVQAMPLLAGADFYLCPSGHESCGLMVMTAAHYGAIPVTTLHGGLADNMDAEIAVLIGDGGISGAAAEAAALYADEPALLAKRAACMRRDFSWATRRAGYLEVYGCSI